MKIIQIRYYDSPAGQLILGAFEGKLCLCDWICGKGLTRTEIQLQQVLDAKFERSADVDKSNNDVITLAISELDEYFARKRETFDIPLLFVGTDFQKKVWNCLLTIPYGQTISYGEMSEKLGMPKAVRAVANANGANPISIFAPCHRVIGSNGKLVGYGGGLKAKEVLLDIESNRLFHA